MFQICFPNYMLSNHFVFTKVFFQKKNVRVFLADSSSCISAHVLLFSRRNVERTQFIHNGYWSTDKKKDSPPPKGITITKGSIHITVSRAFVEYLINDPTAKGTNY